MTQTLVHLSDLHFGRIAGKITDQLQMQLEHLAPDRIIISGDLTQRATHNQFTQASRFINQLPAPSFIVPGNHDQPATVYSRFCCPWKRWQKYINIKTENVHNTKEQMLIGVNSARQWGWYLDWSRGRIDKKQIKEAVKTLKQATENQLRILVIHHPFWLPDKHKHRSLIYNHANALKALYEEGLDLIFGGHVHQAYRKTVHGIIISHAGTATSTRLTNNQANSFNVIKGSRSELHIEQYTWDGRQFSLELIEHYQRKKEQGWQQIKK